MLNHSLPHAPPAVVVASSGSVEILVAAHIVVGSTSINEKHPTTGLPLYSDTRQDKLVGRLNRAEGQVRAINRMVQEQRPCPEVLQQLASVQSALRGVAVEVLRNYLEHCASDAIRSGDTSVYDEMMQTIQRFAK